ncbi:MAG: nuclear transport factor 2 family protein [Solirubrobacteraceae bacterium]
MSTTHTFDLSMFKQAIEERDASTQLGMYAEDAEVTLVDRLAGPSAPRVLHGLGEIRTWIEDVCGRDMTHQVQHAVQDDAGVAFTEACRYPDGKGVVCATVLETDNGLVVRQVGVQAWDE